MTKPTPVRSVADHRSLRERIVARLRDAIITGDRVGKTRLMETELSRQLGVSRKLLREAIRQLKVEGFLTTIPRVGTFVSGLSARDVEDTYVIRAVLEGLAAAAGCGESRSRSSHPRSGQSRRNWSRKPPTTAFTMRRPGASTM
jgi:DNA-binding GntR family transcriptional regulator